MDEQIRQIAERLRGLRDVLELTADDIARDCDISAEDDGKEVKRSTGYNRRVMEYESLDVAEYMGCLLYTSL